MADPTHCVEYAELIADMSERRHVDMHRLRELAGKLRIGDDEQRRAANFKEFVAGLHMQPAAARQFAVGQLSEAILYNRSLVPGRAVMTTSGDVTITPMPSPRKIR